MQHEIAELLQSTNMYEIAYKTSRDMSLDTEEHEVAEQLDAWARDIGKTGHDKDHEIAAFVSRVVNEEIYEAPDELLDTMFERGSVGEFDDYDAYTTPKNTLVPYEAAKGGNVPRSYLDIEIVKPVWKNRQIDTSVSYRDLRMNGWKSVALLTEYATKAFKNAMFSDVFTHIDTVLASGSAVITESGKTPTDASMDALATYLAERADPATCNIIGLYKYILAASKLAAFASDDMKNEVYRTGRLGAYAGIPMTPISSAKKIQNQLVIPDKRIFGVAGAIGNLDMKGEIHVYEDEDNKKEQIDLMFKDFTYGFAIGNQSLENICKITLG